MGIIHNCQSGQAASFPLKMPFPSFFTLNINPSSHLPEVPVHHRDLLLPGKMKWQPFDEPLHRRDGAGL